MDFYTEEEIEKDIFQLEGIKVSIRVSSDTTFLFSKLYSECFTKPMSGDKTVDDLKVKINRFVKDNEFQCMIPQFDRAPNEGDVIAIYEYNYEDGKVVGTKYVEGVREIDQSLFDRLDQKHCHELIIVFTDTKTINRLHKPKH